MKVQLLRAYEKVSHKLLVSTEYLVSRDEILCHICDKPFNTVFMTLSYPMATKNAYFRLGATVRCLLKLYEHNLVFAWKVLFHAINVIIHKMS